MYPKCYISTSYLAGMCHKRFYTHTHTHTQSGQFYNPSSKTGIVLPDFPKMSELNFTKPFPVEKVCRKSSIITSIRKGMGGGRDRREEERRGGGGGSAGVTTEPLCICKSYCSILHSILVIHSLL